MPPDERRLELLEQQLHETRREVSGKLDSIGTALQGLVRIEERQVHANSQLSELSSDLRDHELRLRNTEASIPKRLGQRLEAIETALPGLVEMRRWVITGVLAGLGMIGIAVLNLVLKG